MMDPINISDRLIELVRAVVAQRTNGSIRNLEVSINDGVVILDGRTSRYYYKQLATSAVLDEQSMASFEITNGIHVG